MLSSWSDTEKTGSGESLVNVQTGGHLGMKLKFSFRIFAKIDFVLREHVLTKIDKNDEIFRESFRKNQKCKAEYIHETRALAKRLFQAALRHSRRSIFSSSPIIHLLVR